VRISALATVRISCIYFTSCALLLHLGAQDQRIALSAVGNRYIIIEAQDVGMAASINRASTDASDRELVTSVGVLVPSPWFPYIVNWTKDHPSVDLGIEVDLNAEWPSCRWRPVSARAVGSTLVDSEGYLPMNARYVGEHAKPDIVGAEFRAQIEVAKKAGLSITHLDSHGGIVFYTPWLFEEYWKISRELGLPIAVSKDWVMQRGKPSAKPGIYDVGGVEVDMAEVPFDRILQIGPGISKEDWLGAYKAMLTGLPPGVYLLQVHLGYDDAELQAMTLGHPNWGAQWRQDDFDVISNPKFHEYLKDQGFVVVGWKELKKLMAERKNSAAPQ
jgi:chitin disaccharide deacetylase